MCGISGAIPPVSDALLSLSLEQIAHRGPDGQHTWHSSEISLGHRRLAIMDVSDFGIQPMHRGSLTLVFNGEIYNFPELKKELQSRGHAFSSGSDAEVILAGWQEWNSELLPKMNGMWAFALWDGDSKKLFLSRDRFGEKPLFWSNEDGRFTFGSELKAFLPFLKKWERNPRFREMTADFFSIEPGSNTLINGIHRFPAAHWGEWSEGKLKLHRYWNTLDHIPTVPEKYTEQTEAFRDLLLDAVRIRMRSEVPVGIALSGGVDSTAVLSAMAQVKGVQTDWKHLFVASFPGTALDETDFAKAAAHHFEIQPEVITVDPVKELDCLPEYLYRFEELYITSPVPMMATYHAQAVSGIRVSLDGHGADELFSGYDTFLLHVFKETGLNPFRINSILQTYRNLQPPGTHFKKPAVGWENYRIHATGHPEWKFLWTVLGRELKKGFQSPLIHPPKIKTPEDLGPFNADLYRLFHEQNLPTLLRNYDRYSMASGVEIRMPFLDHRLVAYSFALPWTSKIRKGFTKAILRDAVAPFAPEKVISRKWKMGFQTPIVNWLQGPWKNWMLDIIHSDRFSECDWINGDSVRKQMMDVIQNPSAIYRQGELAWAAIAPFLWEEFVFSKMKEIHSKLQA